MYFANKLKKRTACFNKMIRCSFDITNYSLYQWSHDYTLDMCNRHIDLFKHKLGDIEGYAYPFNPRNVAEIAIDTVNEGISEHTLFNIHLLSYPEALPLPIQGRHIIKHNTLTNWDILNISTNTINIGAGLSFNKPYYLFEILSQDLLDQLNYVPTNNILSFVAYNDITGDLTVRGSLPAMTGGLKLNLIQLYEPRQYLSEALHGINIKLEVRLITGDIK